MVKLPSRMVGQVISKPIIRASRYPRVEERDLWCVARGTRGGRRGWYAVDGACLADRSQ